MESLEKPATGQGAPLSIEALERELLRAPAHIKPLLEVVLAGVKFARAGWRIRKEGSAEDPLEIFIAPGGQEYRKSRTGERADLELPVPHAGALRLVKVARCECENVKHFLGDGEGCPNAATETVETIYGRYEMCSTCSAEFPADFRAPK